MISMHAIGSGGEAAAYHDKAFSQDGVAKEADNYYVNEQALATWQGRGAYILGLDGETVDRKDFVAFLDGKITNPNTGEIQNLADNSKGGDRRAGMDFTISAPKSVSIVGLVGGDDRVLDAHKTANATAMAWLEKHGALIRVKDENGRNTKVQTGNLLYATVQHETSRANEPQIHNHNVIVAATYDTEKQTWRSLTNDALLTLRASADTIYKTELAAGLKAAGYELTYDTKGVDFEIAGIRPEQIEAYSSRSKQIREALQARGFDPDDASWAARQTAALDSRAKKSDVPREVLQEVWQERAQNVGLNLGEVVSRATEKANVTGRVPQGPREPGVVVSAVPTEQREKVALSAVSWAIEHLAEREQSFKLSDLELTAVKFSRAGIGDIELAVKEHLKNNMLVEREPHKDGSVMYTTQKGIQSEIGLKEAILAGKGAGNVVLVDQKEFEAALAAFEAKKTQETGSPYKLSQEQVNSATNILMHADTYQGIQGGAGTGKTAALAMVGEVAEQKGWMVMGIATSAAAAKELEASSGIKSETVASFFVNRDNAIRAVQLDLAEVRKAIDDKGPVRDSDSARTETQKMRVKSADIDFGVGRYTFDHQRGDVFKSPQNLANMVGAFLQDVSSRNQERLSEALTQASTPGDRMRSQVMVKGNDAAASLGRMLTTYEKVGTVEAIAARNTLYTQQDGVRNTLVREYETKRSELENLQRTGNSEGKKVLLVMDESSMTGAHDAEKISRLAKEIGARVVFQGDIQQHGSVTAGRSFEQAQNVGMNVSTLEETRRFDRATPQTKQAIVEMKAGRYDKGVALLDKTEVKEQELPATVARRYLENMDELKARGMTTPKVGIVAVTNADRKAINESVHTLLAEKGLVGKDAHVKEHLDDPKMTQAQQRNAGMLRAAGVDRLVFRKTYREIRVEKNETVRVVGYDVDKNRILAVKDDGREISINPDRQDYFSPAKHETRAYSAGDHVETRAIIKEREADTPRISNGTRGAILNINASGAEIQWADGVKSKLTNNELRFVDLAYAHTTYKEQGATNDREIIAISEIGAKVFNKEAAYVAASRAKDNTEIVTSDMQTLLRNAGKEVGKTTAVKLDLPVQILPGEAMTRFDRAVDAYLEGGSTVPSAILTKTVGPDLEPREQWASNNVLASFDGANDDWRAELSSTESKTRNAPGRELESQGQRASSPEMASFDKAMDDYWQAQASSAGGTTGGHGIDPQDQWAALNAMASFDGADNDWRAEITSSGANTKTTSAAELDSQGKNKSVDKTSNLDHTAENTPAADVAKSKSKDRDQGLSM